MVVGVKHTHVNQIFKRSYLKELMDNFVLLSNFKNVQWLCT